jgi:hypothetical protein
VLALGVKRHPGERNDQKEYNKKEMFFKTGHNFFLSSFNNECVLIVYHSMNCSPFASPLKYGFNSDYIHIVK